MTAYAIVHLNIDDPARMAEYRDKAGGAFTSHGARPVHASPDVRLLEGPAAKPGLIAILSFPDRDAALAWHQDPDLQEIHALRRDVGDCSIFLI